MATRAQRDHLHTLIGELWRFRGHLGYPPRDVRTSLDAASWALTEHERLSLYVNHGSTQDDCSQMCAWLWKAAGLWRWSQPGYTGSHLDLLPVYHDPRGAMVGAGVVFGPGTGHHEAMVYTPDPKHGNPIVFSHGEPGVWIGPLSELEAEQTRNGHPGVRMLSIARL